MSKFEEKTQWRVNYNSYDTFEEAKTEAEKSTLKSWDDTPVWKTVGFAKSSLRPNAVTWTDLA